MNNERTNVTDQGYTYGGTDYVYETRTDAGGNPYQVAVPKGQTTVQTTEAQRTADTDTAQSFEDMMYNKGLYTPPQNDGTQTQDNTQTKTDANTGTRTPEQIVEAYFTQGYTDPYAIYTKMLNSNDPTLDIQKITAQVEKLRNNPGTYLSSQSNAQLRQIDEDRARLQTQFDEIKKNSDIANQRALDNIAAKFDVLRGLLKSNTENLMGAHEKQGYATGGNRYTQMQSVGILTNDQNNYVSKLAELNSKETELVLQASQAKSKEDWDMLSSFMTQIDKLNDNKTTIITNLSKSVAESVKQKEAEAKVTQTAALMGYSDPTKLAQGIAPFILTATENMDAEEMEKYINEKATEYKIKPDILKSALLGAEKDSMFDEAKLTKLKTPTSTRSTSTSSAASKASVHSSIQKLITDRASLGGVPVVDINGFINPQAFEQMVQVAIKAGISRTELFNTYKGKMYAKTRGDYSAYGIK